MRDLRRTNAAASFAADDITRSFAPRSPFSHSAAPLESAASALLLHYGDDCFGDKNLHTDLYSERLVQSSHFHLLFSLHLQVDRRVHPDLDDHRAHRQSQSVRHGPKLDQQPHSFC